MKNYLRTLAKVLLLGFGFGALLAIVMDAAHR